ncbi:hypothetical protein [Yoonia sp. BS5-3]|uniref:DUF4177 domain-containing protein n=1 Tax=Yoonia phaeophyticola TaxID=3137369 RepID=A0ABZ2VBS4_9RHOB
MIYFEHEVLTFGTSNAKEMKKMADTLTEWGAAGYEVVSVVSTSMNGSHVTAFLKRKVLVDDKDEGKAA